MKECFFYTVQQRKIWYVLGMVVLGLFFYLGYQYIGNVNSFSPPISSPVQVQLTPAPSSYPANDSLLDLRLERDRERSQETERIQEMMDKSGLSDDVRKQAEQELWRLTQAVFKERELENLLKAKGFNESMVSVTPKMVTVVVNNKINAQQARIIGDLTAEVTAVPSDKVQIIDKP